MATVVNDRDVLIMGTTPRYTPPTDRGMFLTPSTAVFKLSADGLTASPSSFQFVATLLNMTGNVTWSTTGGISLSVNGNTATLNFASFTAVSGTITATITVDGQQYTQIATVTKLADGAAGPQGSRGNVDISAVTSGSVWSDSEAVAALAAAGYGAPQVRDLVNLYRTDRTFSAQKMYNGSAWIAVDYVWNGNVFVKGSILPEAIDTRGLTIRDAAGNIILNAGKSLAQQAATNPNLCPSPTGMNVYGPAYSARNGDPRFGDGQYVWFNPTSDSSYCGAESPALGIPAQAAYTVSFDAYCTGAARALNADVYASANFDSTGVYINLTNTLTRYSFTETAPNHPDAPLGRLRLFTSAAGGSNIVIANIKVELGATVTPWCNSVISAANVSTFIQAAAIGTAQIAQAAITTALIANAAVGTAQIANAAIDTLRLGNNAVTIPAFASGGSASTSYNSASGDVAVGSVTMTFNDAVNVVAMATWQASTSIGSSSDGGPTFKVSISNAANAFLNSGASQLSAGKTQLYSCSKNAQLGAGTYTFTFYVSNTANNVACQFPSWSVLLLGVMR